MACKRPPVRIRYSPQNCSPAMGLLMFYTYIIYSAKIDRYYIGSCEDIKLRLLQHNSGRNLSTKAGGHWEFKYTETFETRSLAQKREREIKNKKSRKYTEWLINAHH